MYFVSPVVVYAMYRPSWINRRFWPSRYRGLLVPAILSAWVIVLRITAFVNSGQSSGNYIETTAVSASCMWVHDRLH